MHMHRLPVPRASRKSYVKYHQDVMRQIILPVVLVTVLIMAVAVLVAVATLQGGGDVAKWAAIAAIWIIIPLMGLMVVILALAWGVVYLLVRLLQVSPRYTGIAQEYALRFNDQIQLWIDRIMQPILKLKAWLKMFSREE